eukprot:gene2549-745_t
MGFQQGILRYVLALQLAMLFSFCKASFDEFLYDVSGSRGFGKAIAKVDLPSPVHFYNEKFTAIYAHTNGYVTFADEKIWIPSYFSQNKVMAPCMVEIQDNNDLGSIRIAVTSREEQLNRANYDVYAHFAREKEFRAKAVVVVTWDGLLSQKTTVQNVIIIGEEKTFALFLFKNRNGFTFDNSVRFLEAQAGFSSGDSVRLTELLDARRGRHIEYLFKYSNTLTSGKWMFLIGSSGLFQVQMPDLHPVYNPTSGRMVPQDTDECKEGLSVCHRFSDCFNVNIGYKCKCTAGYFGNGRVCIRKYSIVNLEGKVTGKINDVGVDRASFAAQVSSRNGDLVLSIDPVTSRIGHSLKMLPAVAGIIGWLFGKSSDGSQGISVVGNRFKATSIITFKTGEILHIEQHMKGYDSFNSLVFDTDVQGDVPIPLAQPETLSRIGSYAETYAMGDNMKMYSEGTASYIIDDVTIEYKINREISFEPFNDVSAYRALVRISSTETSFFQDSSSGFLRYRQKYTISVPSVKINTTPKTTKAPKKTTQAMPKPTSTKTEQLEITTKAKPTASTFAKKETETKAATETPSREEAKVLVTGSIRQASSFPDNARQMTSVVRGSPEITMQPTKPALPSEGPMTTPITTKADVMTTKPPNCEPQKCAENAICKALTGGSAVAATCAMSIQSASENNHSIFVNAKKATLGTDSGVLSILHVNATNKQNATMMRREPSIVSASLVSKATDTAVLGPFNNYVTLGGWGVLQTSQNAQRKKMPVAIALYARKYPAPFNARVQKGFISDIENETAFPIVPGVSMVEHVLVNLDVDAHQDILEKFANGVITSL